MVQAGDPLEPRFKMTVGTAQAGGLSGRGVEGRRVFFRAAVWWRVVVGTYSVT